MWSVVRASRALAFAALCSLGCSKSSPSPQTGLLIIISTDMTASEYDSIRVEVSQELTLGSGNWDKIEDENKPVPAETTLPATVFVKSGHAADQDALILVTAYLMGEAVVLREAQLQVPTDRVAELRLVLAESCKGQVRVVGAEGEPLSTCAMPGQSCQPDTGMCGDTVIPPDAGLPTYVPGDEKIDAGVGGSVSSGGSGSGSSAPGGSGSGGSSSGGSGSSGANSSGSSSGGVDATVAILDASIETVGDAGADGPASPIEDASDGGLVPCSCVAAPPAGWIGPVVAIEQIVDSDAPIPPPCPPPYPMVAFPFLADPSDAAVACACACEGPCTVQVSAYASDTCDAGDACATATVVSGGCVPLGGCARTAEISSPAAFTGCEVTATKNAPPEWGTIGSVCASNALFFPQGPCEAGQICAPTPPPALGPGMCIYKPGLTVCPTTGYSNLHVYFDNANDTRGCDASACSCGGPASGTCGAPVVTISSLADCSDGSALGSACSAPLAATPRYIGTMIPTSAGSCMPSGEALPVGTVTPVGGTLLCCTD